MTKGWQPKKIDTIIFLVDDLDRSLDFYKNILKLSLKLQSPTWAEFVIGDIHIALHQKTAENLNCPGVPGCLDISVQFEGDDLDDRIAFLKLHGIEIVGGVRDSRFARYAFFTDPDSHILGYREYKKEPVENS